MISIQQTPDTDYIKVHIQDGQKLSTCLLITVLLAIILIKQASKIEPETGKIGVRNRVLFFVELGEWN